MGNEVPLKGFAGLRINSKVANKALFLLCPLRQCNLCDLCAKTFHASKNEPEKCTKNPVAHLSIFTVYILGCNYMQSMSG